MLLDDWIIAKDQIQKRDKLSFIKWHPTVYKELMSQYNIFIEVNWVCFNC